MIFRRPPTPRPSRFSRGCSAHTGTTTRHTIWECYSPTAPAPSSNHGKRVRPDFCGWSALGPISLFIENVLGFHDIDASSRTVRWDIRHDCRHGLNNLTFGDTTTDLLYDPAASTVTVRSTAPYRLILNGKTHRIRPGVTKIKTKGTGQKALRPE